MSPKKAVLKALSASYEENGPESLVRPATIPGFSEAPEKYQKTINDLLKDRLIEGMKDTEGHMALALNTHRMREVRKVLRPAWAHPALLALVALAAMAMGVGLMG
jgi:hypothetical protein